MAGELLSLVLLAGAGLCILARAGWIRHGWNRTHITHALKFGGGLVPHLYGAALIASTNQLFITNMVGVNETGLYQVAAQLGMIIAVLDQSFNLAWMPWLFERLKRNEPRDRRQIRHIQILYSLAMLGLALGLWLVSPLILRLMVASTFIGAAQFIFWLALANAFNGMYRIVVIPIFFANKTHILAWLTFTTGLVNVACNYVLISRHGAVGAAQATAFASLVLYGLTVILARRVMRKITGTAQADLRVAAPGDPLNG